MQIFDSHCHIDDRHFEPDFAEMLQRAKIAEVNRMLIVGVDQRTSDRAVTLARRHTALFAAVGVHPHDSQSCSENILAHLQTLASDPRVVAWGEIGLDFNRMYSPQKEQEHWFIRQLEIAEALGLPLIFHERDSQGRLLEILKMHPCSRRKAVVHCFSGTETELAQYIEMGFCIGVTGIVTIRKRGEPLRQMIPSIPSDRLLVETDAPFLTPTPQRNKFRRNEPAFVREVLLKVAEIRRENPDQLADQIWANTCGLFGIDPSDDAPQA
ncbi:TatD family hydrolase [Desulfosarcina ovata]|uniref:Hydrolase TatD n=1 Tax=Desulfosarcina ovata subsp. ovata TaxID=2752305 RepID=A0A5K8AG83_9BACT|nr:TatD family hydrolase [Desulfosarcina ovata]BBO90884.1 hydrolase TatD [Desulfosarcina ovata subsp. ovata]